MATSQIFSPCSITDICSHLDMHLLPFSSASSRWQTKECGYVDGPSCCRAGRSYNHRRPQGSEQGGGCHVTWDAAPEAALAQRGERWERFPEDTDLWFFLFVLGGQHVAAVVSAYLLLVRQILQNTFQRSDSRLSSDQPVLRCVLITHKPEASFIRISKKAAGTKRLISSTCQTSCRGKQQGLWQGELYWFIITSFHPLPVI